MQKLSIYFSADHYIYGLSRDFSCMQFLRNLMQESNLIYGVSSTDSLNILGSITLGQISWRRGKIVRKENRKQENKEWGKTSKERKRETHKNQSLFSQSSHKSVSLSLDSYLQSPNGPSHHLVPTLEQLCAADPRMKRKWAASFSSLLDW